MIETFHLKANCMLVNKGRVQKKSWNFPIGGGGGGPKIKKNSNFSKNSAILLRMP